LPYAARKLFRIPSVGKFAAEKLTA